MTTGNTLAERVFCIGMNKTGTSTLNHCFEALKLTPIASPKSYDREVRRQIDNFYKHKSYDAMLDLAERFKSFEDRPWNMWTMYRHVHLRFPDSRFILTVRDPESWWRSTERWITVTKPEVLARYQLHLRVHEPSKDSMIESYLRYNREVEAYFKGTDKLLVMDIEKGDGWDKLCGFLSLPVPEREFPHANRQKYTPEDALMIKASRRLKRGVECQACHHVTIAKKEVGAAVSGNKSVPIYLKLTPQNIARRLRTLGPERFRDVPAARQVFYDLHRVRRSLVKLASGSIGAKTSPVLPDRELAVVSCFFNPGGSKRRVSNFQAFLASIRKSGVRCLVVELAFGNNEFSIVDHEDVIQLRTNNVLWHKERLLNIGIRKLLSEGYRKIAWLDGDIVFEDPHWPSEIASRLEQANLCQVFSTIGIQSHESGPPMVAFSAVRYFREYDELYMQPARKGRHMLRGVLKGGQSGFGWAARAEVLEKVLLFESAVVGGGDKLMFIASLADNFSDPRFEGLTQSKLACGSCGHRNHSVAYRAHFADWARQWSAAVNGAVDYARLHIRDMYHGTRGDRGYMTRHDIIYKHEFDPAVDLVRDAAGCLAWAEGRDQMRQGVEAYFLSRREDV
jgi:hypothetical protein